MTYSFSVSNTTTTGSDFLFRLKTQLKAGGWSVKSSSDGTTYNSSGDQITSAGAGAGGMNNSNAWFRIQCPLTDSVNREFTFQVSAAGGANWRVKYSTSAGFTGGSPGSTQTPSSTDQQFIYGGGTDASPTFTGAATNASTSAQYCVGDSSEGYSFYAIQTSTGTINSIFFLDHLDASPSGDLDPVVIYATTASAALSSTTNITQVSSGPLCWIGKGFSYQTFTNVALLLPWRSVAVASVKNFGANPYTSNDNLINAYYARDISSAGSIHGYKGRSHLIMANLNTRTQGTTTNSKVKVQLGDLYFPWDSVTTPSL